MLGFLTSSIGGDYFTVLLEAMSGQCTDLGYTLNILTTRNSSVIKKSDFRKTFRRHFCLSGERIQAPELELLEKAPYQNRISGSRL